jgi:methionyl aminopeptidase
MEQVTENEMIQSEQLEQVAQTKVITHGEWTFDDVPNKYIYDYSPDLIDTCCFTHTPTHVDALYESNQLRKCATIHKIIRKNVQQMLLPNVKYHDIVMYVEENAKKFGAIMAFPVGVSVNEIAAHDSSVNKNDERMFKLGDVVKIDIGLCLDGFIIDSAFTHIIGETSETLKSHRLYPVLEAAHDSMFTAIALSGPDASLYEISEGISEVIKSYEVDDKPLMPLFGLGGHLVEKYKVHGEKLLLSQPHESQKPHRMVEGELYAFETYASTGNGMPRLLGIEKCSHFGFNTEPDKYKLKTKKDLPNAVINWSHSERFDMPFTQRWADDYAHCFSVSKGHNELEMAINITKFNKQLTQAVKDGRIVAYPPLCDNKGTYVGQFEHTVGIKANGVEIYSLGTDY